MGKYMIIIVSTLINSAMLKEILVSQNPISNDTLHCGSSMQPCRTIKHAVNRAAPFDNILVDSGYNHCYQYKLQETINITKTLTLKQYKNYTKSSKPLIVNDPEYKMKSMFFITTNFTVLSVQLNASYKIQKHYNREIFHIKGTGRIMIDRCHLSNAVQIFHISGKGIWYIKMNDSNITNISFPGFKTQFPKRMDKNSTVVINGCIFVMSTGIHFLTILPDRNGQLLIRNSTFVNIALSTMNKRVEIVSNCTFQSSFLVTDFMEVLFLGNTNFLGSIKGSIKGNNRLPQVLILNCPNVTITGCTFIDAMNGSLDVTNSSIHIADTQFINNTQQDSTAQQSVVMSKYSELFIEGCQFENNTARLTPGESINLQILPIPVPQYQLSFINITNSYIKGGKGKNRYNSVVNIPSVNTYSIFHGNVNLSCPTNYYFDYYYSPNNIKPIVIFQFVCVQCPSGTYNTNDEAIIRWEGGTIVPHNITCLDCPYEAVCEDGIKSKGNYWGFISNIGTVDFLPCPSLYCCSSSSTECISYDTCVDGRTGVLCGNCVKGHSLLLFGHSKCQETGECNNAGYFWIFYVLIIFLYIIIFMYMKDIIITIKYLLSAISFKINHRRQSFANNENEEMLIKDEDTITPFILISDQSTDSGEYIEDSSLISGVIKILFFFYQIASIIRINSSKKESFRVPYVIDILASFFNLKIELNTTNFNVCPIHNMNGDVIIVEFIKSGFSLLCLLLLAIMMLIYLIIQKIHLRRNTRSNTTDNRYYCLIDENTSYYSKLPFIVRIKCTYVQLLLIGFSSISVVLFKSIHCVDVLGKTYLYIQGSVVCYNYLQNILICFIVLWVFPFCITLYLGCRLMRSCYITPSQFLFMISFPPISLLYIIQSFGNNDRYLNYEDAILAKQLLLVVNDPFRYVNNKNKIKVEWEPVLIFRRLLIVVVITFILQPIKKLYPVSLLLSIYLLHHIAIKPYKSVLLNMLEGFSLITLGFLTMLNMFWAFIDEVKTKKDDYLTQLGEMLLYVELVTMLLPIIAVFTYLIFIIFKSMIFKCKQD